MPRAVLIVQTRPSDPSRSADYNEWYDKVHLPEVCSISGVRSARRFRLSEVQPGAVDKEQYPYLAIYEIDADDLQLLMDTLNRGTQEGTLHVTDALQQKPDPPAVLYELLTSLP